MKKALFVIGLLFSFQALFCQEAPNKTDSQGRRDGLWKMNFPGTNQTKFIGTFKNGKEVGEFKFYKKGYEEYPSAIMNFDTGNDSIAAKYYTQQGKVISEGMMLNKQRAGKWIMYQEKGDEIMMTEFYKNGKLNGLQTTYFRNGNIGEKTYYKDDIKDGISQIYADNGQLLQDLNYKDGELHGHQTYYNPEGELVAEGDYENGNRVSDKDLSKAQ